MLAPCANSLFLTPLRKKSKLNQMFNDSSTPMQQPETNKVKQTKIKQNQNQTKQSKKTKF